MKNKIKQILIKVVCSILSKKILKRFEIFFSLAQGKGYGIGNVQHEVESCRKLLGRSNVKTVLDIGSYHGEYCDKLLKYYKNSNYFLFEPSRKNYNKLTKKFSLRENINISNIALSDQNGLTKLYSNKIGSDQASLLKRYLNKNHINFKKSENIKTLKLETFFKKKIKSKTIDICKIDVEGLEMKVIKGFGEILKKTKLIQFEFSGANIDSRVFFRDFWNFFKKNNFKIYIITPLGPKLIHEYDMIYETFRVTNYIAINKRYKFQS